MKIAYLADHPEYVPTIATWLHEAWGHLTPGSTLADAVRGMAAYLNHDELPLALIALEGATLLGTASLVLHDMDTRPDLSPWLAGVFVAAEHRRQGYGTGLVRAVEDVAEQLGVEILYLYTPDQENFYARQGWSVLDRTEYRQEQVVIMQKVL